MTGFSRRGRTSVKLLGSLRGAGALAWEGGTAPVTYQLDVFEGRDRRTGSGALDGDLTKLAELEGETARLTLSDGFELEIAVTQADEDGAMFEARGDLPAI